MVLATTIPLAVSTTTQIAAFVFVLLVALIVVPTALADLRTKAQHANWVAAVEADIDGLDRMRDRLSHDVRTVLAETDKVAVSIEHLSADDVALVEARTRALEQAEEARDELARATAELRDHRQQMPVVADQVSTLTAQVRDAEQAAKHARESAAAEAAVAATARDELDALTSQAATLSERLEVCTADADAATQQREAARAELAGAHDELASTKDTIENLRDQIAAREGEVVAVTEAVAGVRAEQQALEVQQVEATRQVAALEAQHDALEATVASLREQAHASVLDDLREDVDRLDAIKAQKRAALAALRDQQNTLAEELADLAAERDTLAGRKISLDREITAIVEQAEAAEREVASLREQHRPMAAEIAELTEREAHLHAARDRVQDELAEKRRRVADREAELRQVREQLVDLRADVEVKGAEVHADKSDLAAVADQLRDVDRLTLDAKAAIADAKQTLTTMGLAADAAVALSGSVDAVTSVVDVLRHAAAELGGLLPADDAGYDASVLASQVDARLSAVLSSAPDAVESLRAAVDRAFAARTGLQSHLASASADVPEATTPEAEATIIEPDSHDAPDHTVGFADASDADDALVSDADASDADVQNMLGLGDYSGTLDALVDRSDLADDEPMGVTELDDDDAFTAALDELDASLNEELSGVPHTNGAANAILDDADPDTEPIIAVPLSDDPAPPASPTPPPAQFSPADRAAADALLHTPDPAASARQEMTRLLGDNFSLDLDEDDLGVDLPDFDGTSGSNGNGHGQPSGFGGPTADEVESRDYVAELLTADSEDDDVVVTVFDE